MSELKPIDGFDQYAASDDGRIWSYIRNRFLKPFPDRHGYQCVGLYVGKKKATRFVHRLVCSAWHGDAPSKNHQVNHKDFCRSNNEKSNLEWVTPKENINHAWNNLPPEAMKIWREGQAKGFATIRKKANSLR